MKTAVYVINRSVDHDRLTRFAASAESLGLPFVRTPAIDAHAEGAPLFLWADYLRDTFWGEPDIKPGAFACALGHDAAWARMLADGCDAALICEDDVALIDAPDAAFAALAERNADLLFVNSRMAQDAYGPLDPASVGTATAPGADCYVVSRAGAERLRRLLRDTGVVAGIDWLMLGWSLPAETRPDRPEFAHLPAATPPLAAFAGPALATLTGVESALSHKVSAPIATLRAAPDPGIEFGELSDPATEDFAAGRYHEAPALALLARWCPPGGVFVDIGAHVGGHSVFMLRHGGAGRAIPFEHNDLAIAALRATFAAAGLEARATLDHLGYGLAEERGKRGVRGSKRKPYSNRLRPDFDESVKVRPGDALLGQDEVALVKIDVCGDEREVLKGLRRTLKRRAPVIGIDLTPPRAAKALPVLERFGYVEADRAEWREGELERVFAVFRPTFAPKRPASGDEDA